METEPLSRLSDQELAKYIDSDDGRADARVEIEILIRLFKKALEKEQKEANAVVLYKNALARQEI